MDYKIGHIHLENNNPGEWANLEGSIKLRASNNFFTNMIQITDMDNYESNWRIYGVSINKDLKYSLYFENGFTIVEVME